MAEDAGAAEAPDWFENAIAGLSPAHRRALIAARQAIEEEAESAAPSHRLEGTLKWGQPSFALRPKRGTAVRLGVSADRPAFFVHCATTLVEDWRMRAGPDADVSGKRAVFINEDAMDALRPFIRSVFDYRVTRSGGD